MDRFLAWYRVTSSAVAVFALVGANLIPLVGVLFFGWNVWMVLIVYWLENGVVGVFNVLKMLKAEGDLGGMATVGLTMNGRSVNQLAKAGIIPFFILHYGIFWAVHGVFVWTMPLFASMGGGGVAAMTDGFEPLAIPFAVLALTISHGMSYWLNFIRGGEYRRVSAAGQMFAPYGRLIVLHVTIIIGGMAIALTGAPAAVVAILVGLKIILDLGFHLAEHRRVAAPA